MMTCDLVFGSALCWSILIASPPVRSTSAYNARVLLKSFLDEGLVVAPSALGCGVAADIAWC